MSQTMPEMKNSSKFFANTDCRYFPCHENISPDRFNCLFCYCPLYPLDEHCGGNFEYVGALHNIKSCSNCVFPHDPENYDLIIAKLTEIKHRNAKTRLFENLDSL